MRRANVQELVTVPSADDMDDDTFCLHMSKRHRDNLGGLTDIWAVDVGTVDAWRAFHDRITALEVEPTHQHLPASNSEGL